MAGNLSTFNSKDRKKGIFHFLLRFLFLLSLVAFLDLALGQGIRLLYFKQKAGYQYRMTYSIDKTGEDILIFGSSRASHHYIPQVFTQVFKRSCFNAGADGQSILFQLALLRAVEKRYDPKVIILDIKFSDFDTSSDNYDRLSILLPYYRSHPEIREIINLRSPIEKFKNISGIYPFNSTVLSILTGILKQVEPEDRNGYLPLYESFKLKLKKENMSHKSLDPNALFALESFAREIRKEKTFAVFVISPYFITLYNTQEKLRVIKRVAYQNGIPLFDYSQDPYFLKNPNLFADEHHLNHEGAKVFSQIIAERVWEEGNREKRQ